MLAFGAETVGSGLTSFVYGTHGFVALVAGKFHLVVLNDVLLYKSLSGLGNLTLFYSFGVEVRLRDEASVARNIACHFSCTDVQFILLVGKFCVLMVKFIARVIAVSTQ